jgi:hypothetical protein
LVKIEYKQTGGILGDSLILGEYHAKTEMIYIYMDAVKAKGVPVEDVVRHELGHHLNFLIDKESV